MNQTIQPNQIYQWMYNGQHGKVLGQDPEDSLFWVVEWPEGRQSSVDIAYAVRHGACVLVGGPGAQLPIGTICPVCSQEFKERLLFFSSYVGCHCK